MLFPLFRIPPLDLKLGPDEIHIWVADLGQPVFPLQEFLGLLSTGERIRAERFRFERDRRNFIARRGILRKILGFYLNADPSRLEFHYGMKGKPELVDISGKGAVHFNLSHSDGVALFAFSPDCEIGVDIEYVRDIPEMEQIVEQFFSEEEKRLLSKLPGSKKKEAFFTCWTRKEAFTKATGAGLFMPLNEFAVSILPGEPARVLKSQADEGALPKWSIGDLKAAQGFAGAFAVEGGGSRLHCWQWSN